MNLKLKVQKAWRKIMFLGLGFTPVLLSACSLFSTPRSNNEGNPLNSELSSDYTNSAMPIISYLRGAKDANFSVPDYSNQKDLFQFLATRVISISVNKKVSPISALTVSGTGWILGKASSLVNDYNYYVATNIHVSNSFQSSFGGTNNSYGSNYRFAINPLITALVQNQNLTSQDFLGQNKKIPLYSSDESYLGVNPYYPMKIDDPSKVFWQAKNIKIKGATEEKTSPLFLRSSQTSLTETSYTNANQETANFAADFSVLKINFLPAYETLRSFDYNNSLAEYGNVTNNKNNLNYFLNNLKTMNDIKFKTSSTNSDNPSNPTKTTGYLLGFPSLWNESENSGLNTFMVNLQINNYDQKPTALEPDYSLEDQGIEAQDGNYYYTPTSDYSVPDLNLGSGSSGSIFVNAQQEVMGIYWGIIADNTNSYKPNKDPKFKQEGVTGQITELRVANKYDLIGGTHALNSTPSTNSLCSSIEASNKLNSNNRVLNFCN